MKNFNKAEFKKLISIDATAAALGVAVAVSALAMMLANAIVGKIGIKIPYCLCHDLLHLYCPFCGCTRAGLALLKLDLLGSLEANPLILLMIVGFLAFNAVSLFRVWRGREIVDLAHFKVAGVIILIVFSLVRNILMIFFDYDTLGELYVFWQNLKGVL